MQKIKKGRASDYRTLFLSRLGPGHERYQNIYIYLENPTKLCSQCWGVRYQAPIFIEKWACIIPTVKRSAPKRIQNLRDSSFSVHGPLFNCLPRCLRDMSNQPINVFKSNLDRLLRLVPDKPLVPGYTAMRSIESNSLLDLKGAISDIPFETVIPEDGDEQMWCWFGG